MSASERNKRQTGGYTRSIYDKCATIAYYGQSHAAASYDAVRPGYKWRFSRDDIVKPLKEVGYSRKQWWNAAEVNTDTKLQHSKQTNPRLIHQLGPRPYLGGFEGPGSGPPPSHIDVESDLRGRSTYISRSVRPPKAAMNRFIPLPEYGNPQRIQHIIPTDRVRGGANTRDIVRQLSFSERAKYASLTRGIHSMTQKDALFASGVKPSDLLKSPFTARSYRQAGEDLPQPTPLPISFPPTSDGASPFGPTLTPTVFPYDEGDAMPLKPPGYRAPPKSIATYLPPPPTGLSTEKAISLTPYKIHH